MLFRVQLKQRTNRSVILMCRDLSMYKSIFMEVDIMHHTQDKGPNSYLKVRADSGSVTQSVNYLANMYNGCFF